ncbi:MAG: tetratricopeptide repeat protein [Bryobacteraceae bacterium]|nr:tetratricopeptide repeat protein [Bryobacteraceae bacterium]MDW8379937.1 tetratricopeptide repeat protein [Bryobacterales bacterium]
MRGFSWIPALAVVAFGGSLAAPFYLDDFALLQDPAVTSPGGWMDCLALTQTRPLTWLSFWLNYQLGGSQPSGYHAVNLGLHLANILVAHQALSGVIPRAVAFLAATVFALHPVQTEAVTYVFARASLIMTLLCLLALRAWLNQRPRLAAGWFALALMAKEECVTFPVVLALLDRSTGRKGTSKPLLAMLGLSLLFGARVLWLSTITPGSGAGAQSGVSPLSYFSVQGLAILRYLRLLIWPQGFTIESPLSLQAAWWAWAPIALSIAIAARRFQGAGAGFWWLAGLLILAPSSSVLPASDLSADRRLYFALLAFAVVAGLGLKKHPAWLTPALGVVLAALSFLESVTWRDPAALWRQALARAPHKVRPYIQLARLSPPSQALELISQAQAFAPADPLLASEKGRIYFESGEVALALNEFGRALALAPNDARMINNRGVALARLGQVAAARMDFERALQREPCFFDALWNLRKLGDTRSPDPRCRFTPSQRRSLDERP